MEGRPLESWRRMFCTGLFGDFFGVIMEPKWETWGASRICSGRGGWMIQFEKSAAGRLLTVLTVGVSDDYFDCDCWRPISGLIWDWLMSSRIESRSGFCGVCLVFELHSSSIFPLIILVVSAFRFSRSKYVSMLFLQICFTDWTFSVLFWSLFFSAWAWLLLLSVK